MHHVSSSRRSKPRPNRSTIGCTLSFLKLLQNSRKDAVLNLALCLGAIWRRREKRNTGAQLQSIRCTMAPKNIWENLHPSWLLVRSLQLVCSEPFAKFDNCCQRYIATCRKKIIYVLIDILGPELPRCYFFKSLSYLCEVVCTGFSADFRTFGNYRLQFRENCSDT